MQKPLRNELDLLLDNDDQVYNLTLIKKDQKKTLACNGVKILKVYGYSKNYMLLLSNS